MSDQAEIRVTLENAVRPVARIKLGTALAEFGAKFGPIDYVQPRDPQPIKAAIF